MSLPCALAEQYTYFVDKTFEQSNLLTLTIVCRAFITREIQRQNCVHCKTSRSTGFEVFTGFQHTAFHCLFRYVTVKFVDVTKQTQFYRVM